MMLFLDKDVLLDYIHKHLFGEQRRLHAVQLVEKINRGEVDACVAEGTIFSLYNHALYKLQRPSFKGGQSLEEPEAQAKAREFIKNLFGPDSWRVVSLGKKEIYNALDDGAYDFEDALQYYSFKKSGADRFVTWNLKHFRVPRATNPKQLLLKL